MILTTKEKIKLIKQYKKELKEFLKLCKEYDFVVRQHVLKTRIDQLGWLKLKPIFKNQLKLIFKRTSFSSFENNLKHYTYIINEYIKWYNNDIYKLVEQYQ